MVELLGLLGFVDYIRGQGGLGSCGVWFSYDKNTVFWWSYNVVVRGVVIVNI